MTASVRGWTSQLCVCYGQDMVGFLVLHPLRNKSTCNLTWSTRPNAISRYLHHIIAQFVSIAKIYPRYLDGVGQPLTNSIPLMLNIPTVWSPINVMSSLHPPWWGWCFTWKPWRLGDHFNQTTMYDRRKFRSQTSDNVDRWKAEQGRGREKRKIRREKIREEKESEERRCRCAKR